MAFYKTGDALRKPFQTLLTVPKIGDERDGLVWDGEEWVPKETFGLKKSTSKCDGGDSDGT